MSGIVDRPGLEQACEDGINFAISPHGVCSNLVRVSGRRMLADGSMLVTFNVRSSNPDIKGIIDTALTGGAVSQSMANADESFAGYTFTATNTVVTQGSTNTAVTSSSTSSSSNTSSSTGTIAGAVVGVFAALAIAAGLMYYRYRNKDLNIMQEQEDAVVREASHRFDFSDIHKNSESGLISNREL